MRNYFADSLLAVNPAHGLDTKQLNLDVIFQPVVPLFEQSPPPLRPEFLNTFLNEERRTIEVTLFSLSELFFPA